MAEDIKLNEFERVQEITELLGLDYNGNGCSILPTTLLAPLFQIRGTVTKNVDYCTVTGLYGINKDIYNIGVCSYGMLVVFNAQDTANGGNPIAQFIISSNGDIQIRVKWHTEDFSPWRTISFT